jgi:chromosome partitioning protein
VSEPEHTLSPAVSGPQCRILAIANQKGGVGKTTTAVNLATAMAAIKKRVLLIDLDPQGNASTGLGLNHRTRRNGTYSVLIEDTPIEDVITPSMVPYLDLVPASVSLSGAELELVNADRREHRLRQALQYLTRPYDFIMIDCPPALGLLTLNAMVAADGVLVPLQCEYYALEGLSYLVKTIERVRKVFNPRLELQGVVLTMYDSRNRLSDQVASDVRGHFGAIVYDTVIPRNVRISEAPSHGKPVILYDTRCIGSRAYVSLAREVLRRETALKATLAASAPSAHPKKAPSKERLPA